MSRTSSPSRERRGAGERYLGARLVVSAEREEAAVAALWEAGCLGVHVTTATQRRGRVTLKAYFPGRVDRRQLERSLCGALRGSGFPGRTRPRFTVIPDRCWAVTWQRSLRPMRIGRRFLLVPQSTRPSRAGDRIVIRVRFGQAFGTGEHPSTRLCLRLLESNLNTGDRVVDIGTGTGVLAIAAHRLGAGRVVAIDHDPVALSVARDTLADNGLLGEIELQEADALEPGRLGRFDLALVNIGAAVIGPLLRTLAQTLVRGGRAILAGLLVDDEKGLIEQGMRLGYRLEGRLRSRPWSALLLSRAGQS